MHGHSGIDRVLLTSDQILSRVGAMAADIVHDYEGEDGLIIVPILTGAMVFTCDLIRRMPVPMKIGLLTVSSYPGTATTSQGVKFVEDQIEKLKERVVGRPVLLVDDILDSGNTLRAVTAELKELGAKSVKTCVLLRKENRPEAADVVGDYVGFDIPDAFVVGYGLDYNDMYRNLPDIVVLKDETFS
ncbi:MAG: hypoxanthine phosphoribosyltransferase [Planctomycetota bacterium]